MVTPDVRFPAGMTVGTGVRFPFPPAPAWTAFFLCAMQKRDS